MENFETKKVGQPMLDKETKNQIQPASPIGPDPVIGLPKKPSGFLGKNKWYVIVGAGALLVIGLLAFFALRKPAEIKEAKVEVTIDAPQDFPSSGDIIVKVGIENKDPEKLVGMELELVYPEGVSYASSTPQPKNLSGTLFPVPDLVSGQNAVVVLKLRTQGSVGESKKLVAKLGYKYSNFSASFVKEVSHASTVISSKLVLDLQGPNSTNNTQLVNYILKYVNDDDKPIDNGRVEFTYPKGFNFSTADPLPSIGKNVWNIAHLNAHQSGQITITGTFNAATPGETQSFTVVYSVLDPNGSYHTQASSSYNTVIASVPLLVSQELDQSNGKLVVNPGDTLTYNIRYQNNATFAARSVNIVLAFDSKAVDVNSIQAEGAQVSGNTITWNTSSSSNLEVMNPGEEGTLRLTLKVKNPPVKDSSKNIEIKSTIKIKSDEYDTYLPGNELVLKVSSLASLNTRLVYSSGPLPPKVGQSTTYTITFLLQNLTNDIVDGTVNAFLALDPSSFDPNSITPQTESGKFQFDSSSGKITWSVGRLLAHTGDFNAARSLSFSLRLNPAASQVGEAPVLVRNINFLGTDSFTGETVRLDTDDITTDQLPGEDGYTKGRVEQ